MHDYTYQDMLRMQEEAAVRVREMKKRATLIMDDESEEKKELEKISKKTALPDEVKHISYPVEIGMPKKEVLSDKSASDWAEFYRGLERLDSRWDEYLSYLDSCKAIEVSLNDEKQAENLLCYFLYRHLPSALDDGDIGSKIAFAVHACRLIFTLAQKYPVEDAARMYSAEIEYSDENTDEILSVLSD